MHDMVVDIIPANNQPIALRSLNGPFERKTAATARCPEIHDGISYRRFERTFLAGDHLDLRNFVNHIQFYPWTTRWSITPNSGVPSGNVASIRT